MNLCLELVADELAHYPSHILRRNKISQRRLQMKGVGIYRRGMNFSSDICYMVSAKNVTDRFNCPNNTTLIVIGSVNDGIFERANSDILILEGEMRKEDFYDIFNEISDIFVKYQEIDHRLYETVSKNEGFEKVVTIGQELFNNPVIIFDQNYCVMNNLDYEIPGITWSVDPWSGSKILPLDAINTIKTSPEYIHKKADGGIFFISEDYFPCNMILASVKKKLRITVAVLETQAPLMESHRILAKYFADFIHLTFNKNYIHTGHPVRFENFLKELLDNHQMEQACIDRYLLSMNWKNTDTYICMTYQTSRWDKVGVVYYNVCTNLELQFPGSFAFYYDDAIIFLVNLTQQGLERQQLIYWLSSFLTEGVFRVGISYDFFEFHTFPSYYLQTLGALEMGTKYAPDEWCYDFRDYVFYYFLHYGTSRIDGRHLCFPGIVQLYIYDTKNQTDLLHTLRVYIQCERNVALTVKNLYIHRNTLYQRLRKIEAILDADLNDEKVRLFIHLSYQFVEHLSLEPVL